MNLPISERALRDERQLTPSDNASADVNPGRALEINCTVAGNVSMVLGSGKTIVRPVNVGLSRLSYEVRRINVTGTTATATYFNMD